MSMLPILSLAMALLLGAGACTQAVTITGPDCFANADASGGGGGEGSATGGGGGGAPGSSSAASGCTGGAVVSE